jgi:5-methylthioribose kinase
MTNKDFLEHFGILGMKWGRRKGKSIIPKKTVKGSEDYERKQSLKKKNIKQLSNTELKALNERLQLERSYKDLTKSEKNIGRKFMEDILMDIAKDTVKSFVKQGVNKGVSKSTTMFKKSKYQR